MKPVAFSIFLLSLAVLGAPNGLLAIERMQGAFYLTRTSGQAELKEPGQDAVSIGPGSESLFLGAVLHLDMPGETSLLLQASNGAAMRLDGPGEFAVERFVQAAWTGPLPAYGEALAEPSESRMVLNLRRGRLSFDGSRLASGTRIGLEMPVGSFVAGTAEWSVEIFYDPRNRIYNFSIKLRGGEVKFTDRRGRNYRLYPGQQLNGVGSSGSPAIEIGELQESSLEVFELLREQQAVAPDNGPGWDDFKEMMKPIAETAEAVVPEAFSEARLLSDEGQRPITIDFVPRVPDSIPFRAVIRPPSAYEEQLF